MISKPLPCPNLFAWDAKLILLHFVSQCISEGSVVNYCFSFKFVMYSASVSLEKPNKSNDVIIVIFLYKCGVYASGFVFC